jgi:hypothetical protein
MKFKELMIGDKFYLNDYIYVKSSMFDTVLNSFSVIENSFARIEDNIDVEEVLDNTTFSVEITKNACLIIRNGYVDRVEFKDMKEYIKK